VNKARSALLLFLFLVPSLAYSALRDPTTPLDGGVVRKEQSALVLQAIFLADTSRYAVINGRTVYVGDKVNDWTLEVISRKGVRLARRGESRELALRKRISVTR